MKVGLILEDPTLDAHIAVPVMERIFAELGQTAQVRALRRHRSLGCRDPRPGH